jgi:hypothetical protein
LVKCGADWQGTEKKNTSLQSPSNQIKQNNSPKIPGYRISNASFFGLTMDKLGVKALLVKFRHPFLRRSALRPHGLLEFALLGRPSARRALLRVPYGGLRDALFGLLSVQLGVSRVPLGDRSAEIAAPPDESRVLHGA